jgi:hypothetical protein
LKILRYDPGDVIIFMAGAIFHSVTPWTATPMKEGSPCTPGRIGHVFFFPARSYRGKEKGWSSQTNGGLLELKKLGLTNQHLKEDVEEDAQGAV